MLPDPLLALRDAGETVAPQLRAELLALGPGLIAHLVDLLADRHAGWARVHACDLLIDLRVAAVVPMMLRICADDFATADESVMDERLTLRIAARLRELGKATLEPSLAFAVENTTDEHAAFAVCNLVVRLGINDDRILQLAERVFRDDASLGAGMLAAYGDPRGAALIEEALGLLRSTPPSQWDPCCVKDMLEAHRALGGVLAAELRERIDGSLGECDCDETPISELN